MGVRFNTAYFKIFPPKRLLLEPRHFFQNYISKKKHLIYLKSLSFLGYYCHVCNEKSKVSSYLEGGIYLHFNTYNSLNWVRQKSSKFYKEWLLHDIRKELQYTHLTKTNNIHTHNAPKLTCSIHTNKGMNVLENKGSVFLQSHFTGQWGGKVFACPFRRPGLDSWVGKTPCGRKWQPTPLFLPGESHGQRRLAGCRPWGPRRVGHDCATSQHDKLHSGRASVRTPASAPRSARTS